MINAEQSDKLLCFFENMLSFYREFLSFERGKHDILLSGDFPKLDESLRQEQAFTLKARGLEHDRVKLLEESGTTGSTFRELIPQIEVSRQEKMRGLYKDISAAVEDIRQVNERSNHLIRINMGHVSKILSHLENHPELKQVYNDRLKNEAGHESSFSRKV